VPQSSSIITSDSITVYTDGSCHTQFKAGGWAALLFVGEEKILLDGDAVDTTHHRMELTAVIQSLRYLEQNQLMARSINLYCDSQYVVDLVKRKDRLLSSNFLTKKLKAVRNADLVRELLPYMQYLNVMFIKVKSHQTLSTPAAVLNREVDLLSRKKMRSRIQIEK
jgi:ribonuclease HI